MFNSVLKKKSNYIGIKMHPPLLPNGSIKMATSNCLVPTIKGLSLSTKFMFLSLMPNKDN